MEPRAGLGAFEKRHFPTSATAQSPQRLSYPCCSEPTTVLFYSGRSAVQIVERVRIYHNTSVIQQPARDQVTGVRFPVRYFYSSRLLWYPKALHLPLTMNVRTTTYQKLVLVSFTGHKTKNRGFHCLAPHFIS